jgi:gliding motility-associated-like protein
MNFCFRLLTLLIFSFLSIVAFAQSPTCNINAVRTAFTQAGYIELNVAGQPCSMYFVNPNSQDADQAQASARNLGANVVVFQDAAENNAVAAALNTAGYGSTAIWIGYKRSGIAANTFYALDGTTGNFLTPTTGGPTPGIYQNWNPSTPEPNNSGFNNCTGGCGFIGCNTYKCINGEQCVQIFPNNGLWNDLGCNSSSISVIEINLCPEITVPAPPTICVGEPATLRASTLLGSTPYTYDWDNGLGTGATVTTSPAATTNYSVTVTDRYNCTANQTVTVNVNPNCTAPVCDVQAIRNAFAAATGYVELTGVVGQPCSMYFVNTRNQNADLSQQQAQALGANMVVFNDVNENSAVAAALNANGYGAQAIWIGYKRTGTNQGTFFALDGTTGPFNPGPATPALYQNWNGGEPNNNGYNDCFGGCNFIGCDTYRCQNGEQCVQVFAGGGQWNDLPCDRNSISVVEINLCPQPTVTQAQALCAGQSAQLSVSTILGSAPYTYTWDNGSTGTPITVAPTESTTYILTVSDRYNCTTYETVNVTVENGAPTTFSVPSVVCANSNAYIEYTGTGAPTETYNWNFDGGTVVTGTGPGPYEVVWTTPGVKTITLSIPGSNGCSEPPTSQQITVNLQYTNSFNAPDSICQFANATINYTGNGGAGETYNWNFDGGTIVSGAGQGPYQISWATPGLKTVTLNVTSPGGCTLPNDTSFVFVIPQPIANAGQDATVCSGGTVNLGAAPTAGFTYSWTPATNLSAANIGNPVFRFSNQSQQPATFTYFLNASVLGCSSRDTVAISVDPAQPLNVTVSGPTQFCEGESVTLTADAGYNNYTWNDATTGASYTITSAGSYFITAEDGQGCEFLSPATAVTVFDKPELVIDVLNNVSCFGFNDGNVSFVTTGGTPTYQYAFDDGTPIQGNNASGLTPSNYTVIVFDGVQCSDTVFFTITEPIAPLGIDLLSLENVRCFGESSGSITVTGTNGTPPYTYNWSNGDTDANAGSIAIGNYSVTVTDANGCTETDSYDITQPAPLLVTIQPEYEVLLGNTVVLNPAYEGNEPLFFEWTPSTFLNNAAIDTPTARPFVTTTYTVTVSDTNQCEVSAATTVLVNDSIKIYIPNIFSPNADGINDVFLFYANAVKDVYYIIYNRWGEKVFESKDITAGWDGTYKGKLAPEGVYTYYIQFTFLNFTQEKRKGSVTLVR